MGDLRWVGVGCEINGMERHGMGYGIHESDDFTRYIRESESMIV